MAKGAVGNTYSHDSHNITIIYNDLRMLLSFLKEIAEIGGGVIVAEKGKIIDELPFPIAGMLSQKPAKMSV